MDTLRFILVLALALVSIMLLGSMATGLRVCVVPFKRSGIGAGRRRSGDSTDKARRPGYGGFAAHQTARLRQAAPLVTVETDVMRLGIDRGGTIVYAELSDYPVSLDRKDEPFVLLDDSASLYHVIQSGIVGESAPTHRDTFSAERQVYTLDADAQVLEVPLRWTSPDGVSVTKVFEFERGSYRIHLRYIIENGSAGEWEGRQYTQIKRDDPSREGRKLIYTYTGAVLSSPDNRYEKISFDDMEGQG